MVVPNEVNNLGYVSSYTPKWKHERNLTLPDASGPRNFFSWIEFQIAMATVWLLVEVNHTDLVDNYVIDSRSGLRAGLNRSKLDLREQVWE